MPIYEYRCGACEREFEYQQRMADDPKTVCEACGGSLERLISRSAFHLKGGGWYKDLYSSTKPASGGTGSSDPGSSAPSPSPASSSSGSSDASSSSSAPSGSPSSTPSTPTPSKAASAS